MATFSTGPGEIRGPVGVGTISVRELERPLEGKGLRLLQKARELLARGERERGLEQLRVAMGDQIAEPYALAMLGNEHLRAGDYDSAIRELQTSLQLLPGQAGTHSNLALALGVRQRNEEAHIEARKALQLDPGRAKARFVIGQILLQMGRAKEAEFHLKLAAVDLPGARALLTKYFNPEAQSR